MKSRRLGAPSSVVSKPTKDEIYIMSDDDDAVLSNSERVISDEAEKADSWEEVDSCEEDVESEEDGDACDDDEDEYGDDEDEDDEEYDPRAKSTPVGYANLSMVPQKRKRATTFSHVNYVVLVYPYNPDAPQVAKVYGIVRALSEKHAIWFEEGINNFLDVLLSYSPLEGTVDDLCLLDIRVPIRAFRALY